MEQRQQGEEATGPITNRAEDVRGEDRGLGLGLPSVPALLAPVSLATTAAGSPVGDSPRPGSVGGAWSEPAG